MFRYGIVVDDRLHFGLHLFDMAGDTGWAGIDRHVGSLSDRVKLKRADGMAGRIVLPVTALRHERSGWSYHHIRPGLQGIVR